MKVEINYIDRNGEYQEPVTLDWDAPFFPRMGESFDLDAFFEQIDPEGEYDENIHGLSWDINWIKWLNIKGVVTAQLFLTNEFFSKG